MTEGELRRALVDIGCLLHERGLIAGTAGNLSARLADGRVLVTPRGVRKDRMHGDDLLALDAASPDPEVLGRATSEWPLHAACYAADADVGAVVHTHAPGLTALGLRGADGHARLARMLPEVADAVGGIATVAWAPSGSEELARAAGEAVSAGACVLLLRRHGAASTGPDPWVAANRMELAELAARAVLSAG